MYNSLVQFLLAVWQRIMGEAPKHDISLIGGTRWRSTVVYYSVINETFYKQEQRFPVIRVESVDLVAFKAAVQRVRAGDEEALVEYLKPFVYELRDGTGVAALCSSTAHEALPRLEVHFPNITWITMPSAVGEYCRAHNFHSVGVLGAAEVYEDWYPRALASYGVRTVYNPDASEIRKLQNIINKELGQGIVTPESLRWVNEMIGKLKTRGADAVILACTELSLMNVAVSADVIDTARVHARAIVAASCGNA